jgi:hypothetical protein
MAKCVAVKFKVPYSQFLSCWKKNGKEKEEDVFKWNSRTLFREWTFYLAVHNVRKNAAHKESSREKSHVHRAKFNGRPKLPGWPGKKWRSSEPGPGKAFIEGEGKEVSACAAVSGRGGAVLESRNLSLGVSQVRSEDKMDADLEMVTLLFYHRRTKAHRTANFPTFPFFDKFY